MGGGGGVHFIYWFLVSISGQKYFNPKILHINDGHGKKRARII